jgi:hypothetical protein
MSQPKLVTLTNHPDGRRWHAAIGRVVVTFGTLERLLLSYAELFAPTLGLLRKHHKDDMKAIAPALKRVIESRANLLPRLLYKEVMAGIVEAESLIQARNDAAHGWLQTKDDTEPGPIGFFVAKKDSRPKRVFGVRELEWLNEVAKRIRDNTRRNHAALTAIARTDVF